MGAEVAVCRAFRVAGGAKLTQRSGGLCEIFTRTAISAEAAVCRPFRAAFGAIAAERHGGGGRSVC